MQPQNWPVPKEGDYITNQYDFQDGSSLSSLKLHYRTVGTLRRDSHGKATNAVLILHGTTGSGTDFFSDIFAGKLFNQGQPLAAGEHFLILPDSIGHGRSTKPSDGLRARFPRYCYTDMVRAQYLLLTKHLGVDHLRLVMGTSMGGMHTWVWGTVYPDFMDALMPLASLPAQLSGRNRMWRKHAIDSIRNDPEFEEGNYQKQPKGFRTSLYLMAHMAASPLMLQSAAPDWNSADKLVDRTIEQALRGKDANDFAYAFDSSWEYNPSPGLERIKAPLTAINFADDPICPPELRILENETEKVEKGVAIVMPISDKTVGHGTHSVAEVWKQYLVDLLARSEQISRPKL